jgi:predicted CXXCH cytochrome family protein
MYRHRGFLFFTVSFCFVFYRDALLMKLNYVLERLAGMPVLAMALLLAISGCSEKTGEKKPETASQAKPASYIGSEQCADCHQQQFKDWQGSHHQLAMALPDAQSVQGNFDNTEFTLHGQTSRFEKEGDQFKVITDGNDGSRQSFDISATFGLYPLQQYLIDFPDGHKQALSISWDSREKNEGGQRWFHLYPEDQVTPQDVLHWTGPNQNWNYQCADCHSTDLRKNYNAANNSYDTQYAEISVGCEACHGPASNHIEWSQNQLGLANKGFAVDLKNTDTQVNACAHCHSRRSQLRDGFTPDKDFHDYYLPSLLRPGMYHSDGQILEEVYVWGSFQQSKMAQQGVVCSDCHNTHAAKLKAEGNAVCTQCHNPAPPKRFATLQAGNYDSEEHHFHTPGSEGAQCRNCHMPAKTYMGVDERYDHSFRIPRPDLSDKLASPNACTQCHNDKSNTWAADILQARKAKRPVHYGETIAALLQQQSDAREQLLKTLQDKDLPPIQRATVLSMLGPYLDGENISLLKKARYDDNPLVRHGALLAAASLPQDQQWRFANGLLDDPVLSVRMEAGRLLAPFSRQLSDAAEQQRLRNAVNDYIAAQQFNGERPEAHSNLGTLHARMGDIAAAEKAYLQALKLSKQWVPAYINLADLYRATQRDDKALEYLSRGIEAVPDNADLQHALGLWQSRAGLAKKAATSLTTAADLAPGNARYRYVAAIALHGIGESKKASKRLQESLQAFPNDSDLLFASATIHRDMGQRDLAQAALEKLMQLRPNDPSLIQLQREISQLPPRT